MLYFLLAPDRPISDAMARLLYAVAKDMAKNRLRSKRFKSQEGEGVLTTSWKSGNMGTISGTEFKAEMVTSRGENTATFLVRSYDLEDDGGWAITRTSMEALPDIERQVAETERPSRLN